MCVCVRRIMVVFRKQSNQSRWQQLGAESTVNGDEEPLGTDRRRFISRPSVRHADSSACVVIL